MMSDIKLYKGHVHKGKNISFFLVVFFLLIFINNKDLFLDVGINLRPFYFLVVLLLAYLPRMAAKRWKVYLSYMMIYALIFFFGVFGWFFSPGFVEGSDAIIYVIFFFVQILTFFVLIRSFETCDLITLFKGLKQVLPIITVLPLLLFFYKFGSRFGVRNEVVLGIYTGHDGMPRLIGLFEDPNYFSLYMFSFLTILFFINQSLKEKFSKFDITFVVIGIIDIALTQSRSAIGVMFLFVFLIAIFYRNRKLIGAIAIVFVVALIALSYIDADIMDIVSQRYENIEDDGSANERFSLMQEGMLAPFIVPFGVGVGNCKSYFAMSIGPKLAHNDWLTVLVECGVIGFILYLLLWIKVFKNGNTISRILILCIMIQLATLSAYGYDPIVPTVLAFYACFTKKKVIVWNTKS